MAHFLLEHHKLYGKWLPFGWGDDEMPLDEVTLDSCKFIVWMTISNTHEWHHINPIMPHINDIAEAVFVYLIDVFYDIAINTEMLDQLYGDDDDFYKVRNVLEWIANDSYLSDWDVTRDVLETHVKTLKQMFKNTFGEPWIYGARAMSAFGSGVGPLALFPQEWYAAMLQTYEEKDCSWKASLVSEMKFARFDKYFIDSSSEKIINVKDLDGNHYAIDRESLGAITGGKEIPSNYNLYVGMLVLYKGLWQINGISMITSTLKDYDEEKKKNLEYKDKHELAAKYFERFVQNHKNRRLYYFEDISAMEKWLRDEIKFKNASGFVKTLPNYMKKDERIIVFIPSDGDPEITVHDIESIKDPNNPYYNEQVSREVGFELINAIYSIRKECFHYLLDHGMLTDLSYRDYDPERGHKLFQENIDFIARFTRRAGY